VTPFNTYESRGWGRAIRAQSAVTLLIAVNVASYLATFLAGTRFLAGLALVPHDTWSKGTFWQFATYLFLHGGFLHLFFNMYSLWVFGRDVEALWGRAAFLRYYFITGISAGIVHTLITPHSTTPTLGASGAVMGVLAAFAILFPDREIALLLFFVFPIRMRARTLALIFAGLSLAAGMAASPDHIAHFAHLGGMLAGLVYLKWPSILSLRANRNVRRKWRKQKRQNENRMRMEAKVNRILDRANAVGMDKLGWRERRFLKKAGRQMRGKP
jgi:membrane associated rhomboid family serine protease